MHRPVHLLLALCLFGAAVGCRKKAEDASGAEAATQPADGAGSEPVPRVQGEADVDVMTKEESALKPFGATVVPDRDGLDVWFVAQNLTATGEIQPDLLAGLKTTTTLRGLNCMAAPEFSDAGLESLHEFTNLRKLLVHGTKVTDAGLVHVGGMTKLEELDLSDTRVTDKGLAHLKSIQGLTMLDLGAAFGKQDVTDVGLAQLKLDNLNRLQIGGTKITDSGLAHLKGAGHLSVLWAQNCDITDTGLEHLKPLNEMSWLILEGTKITDAGLVHIEGCSRLFSLDVRGTGVTQAGAAKLQAKLPKCEIAGTGWELKPK